MNYSKLTKPTKLSRSQAQKDPLRDSRASAIILRLIYPRRTEPQAIDLLRPLLRANAINYGDHYGAANRCQINPVC
jgi:hypothetical protein